MPKKEYVGFSIDLLCECGASAKYRFATQEAHDEYMELWRKQHDGEGHRQMTRQEYNWIQKQRATL